MRQEQDVKLLLPEAYLMFNHIKHLRKSYGPDTGMIDKIVVQLFIIKM